MLTLKLFNSNILTLKFFNTNIFHAKFLTVIFLRLKFLTLIFLTLKIFNTKKSEKVKLSINLSIFFRKLLKKRFLNFEISNGKTKVFKDI